MATPSQEQPAQPLGGGMIASHFQPHPTEHKDVGVGQGQGQGQQTPPNSADGKKTASDGVPSELSDLDLEHNGGGGGQEQHASIEEPEGGGGPAAAEEVDEEEEDIEPDHYYGGGKIPVFKPRLCFSACVVYVAITFSFMLRFCFFVLAVSSARGVQRAGYRYGRMSIIKRKETHGNRAGTVEVLARLRG
ncbi:hypothetical protein FQN54_008128 [Arachnomyces sp. PD_36]|nr:hypothetical protein FQN54_008128 [Arachnomyces sp. PD_36]